MYVYGFTGHLDSIDSEYGQIATPTVGTCYSILTASRATSADVHFKHQYQGVAHANDSYYSCSRMLPNPSHVGAQQMPQQQCFYQNDRKHPKGTTRKPMPHNSLYPLHPPRPLPRSAPGTRLRYHYWQRNGEGCSRTTRVDAHVQGGKWVGGYGGS